MKMNNRSIIVRWFVLVIFALTLITTVSAIRKWRKFGGFGRKWGGGWGGGKWGGIGWVGGGFWG